MYKNLYSGKFILHLSANKNWFVSLKGISILPRKKGAGFIVFEGLDGCGKSVQAKLLKKFLEKKGFGVVLTKEPTGNSRAGKTIRLVLAKKKKMSQKKLQALYSQDRKNHLTRIIIPNLKKGKVVISDRYFFSSLAYGSLGMPLSYSLKLNEKFVLPDLVFFIDVKPKICFSRIEARKSKMTLFEDEEKFKKVRKYYKKIFKKFRNVIIINGEKSIKKVHQEITKKLKTEK